MLIQMHKHMKWIMWTIVVLITIAFLFFGIYPSDSTGNTVAKVDGHAIGYDEFNRVYRNMAENYRRILKDQFNDSYEQVLRKQALQELINDRLLVHEAERKGLKVTDQELQSYIMQIPAFSSQSGQFDNQVYQRALQSINMNPSKFEEGQREYLLRQKLERLVEDGVAVVDADLTAAYAVRNPKAKKGEFEKNKESFKQTYMAEKRREALDAYVKGLTSKAKIKINEQTAAL